MKIVYQYRIKDSSSGKYLKRMAGAVNYDSEEWVDIIDWEGKYQISNKGRVRSVTRSVGHRWGGEAIKKGKILKLQKDKHGCLQVGLSNGIKSITKKVHRLTAINWVPNPTNLSEVNHEDLNKENNNNWNLRWTDRKGNQKHASVNNVFSGKFNSNRGKSINYEQACEIRRMVANGKTRKEISEKYNISESTVSRIVTNRIWV